MEISEFHNAHRVKSGMKLYEQVLSQIKDMILQGLYRKGDLLPSEKELMQMMGVSRITVREALRRLNASGVIETQRGKGSVVRIDCDDFLLNHAEGESYRRAFLHATDARILLEPAIAATLARTANQELLAQLSICFEEGQPPAAFHAALIEAMDNPVISAWFAETAELEAGAMMNRMIPPSKQKREAHTLEQQHRRVFEAIRDGREEKASRYMLEHLQYIRRIYEDYFSIYF